jgi:hypothetical protein
MATVSSGPQGGVSATASGRGHSHSWMSARLGNKLSETHKHSEAETPVNMGSIN